MTSSRRAGEPERRSSLPPWRRKNFAQSGSDLRSGPPRKFTDYRNGSIKQADIPWICFLAQEFSKNLHIGIVKHPVFLKKQQKKTPADFPGQFRNVDNGDPAQDHTRVWDWRRVVQGKEVDMASDLSLNPSEIESLS